MNGGNTALGKALKEQLTLCLWKAHGFHLHDKVALEEHEADDGKQVDEDDSQNSSQDDGSAISGHRLDDV